MDCKKERLAYLDVAKGIGILLVVFGHVEYINDGIRGWLTSFHMPLFFLISGILLAYKGEESLPIRDFALKKCKSILVPYLSFSLLYLIVDIIDLSLGRTDVQGIKSNVIDTVSFYGVSTLWFLPALFVSEILAFILIKKLKKPIAFTAVALVITVVGFVLSSSIGSSTTVLTQVVHNVIFALIRSFVLLIFVVFGYVSYKMFLKSTEFSIGELLTGILLFVAGIFVSRINGIVDYRILSLKCFPVSVLLASAISLSVILICKNIREIKLLSFFGSNSLTVMATHLRCYILYWAALLAWVVDPIVKHAKVYVFTFNTMLFALIMEAAVIFLINRFLPFMVGKKKR